MVGGLITTKLSVLMPVPSAVVTLILPVTAVSGAVIVTDVSVDAVTGTTTAPILTVGSVVPTLRLTPVIVTGLVAGPLVGVKLSIFGATLKFAALWAVFARFVTEILPVVAPAGTVALIDVADRIVNVVTAVPLNVTSVTEFRFVPLIVTSAPVGALAGVKAVIVGALITMKSVALIPVPSVVITLILPVTAVAGTVTVT